jgi:hypothetical protein
MCVGGVVGGCGEEGVCVEREEEVEGGGEVSRRKNGCGGNK